MPKSYNKKIYSSNNSDKTTVSCKPISANCIKFCRRSTLKIYYCIL